VTGHVSLLGGHKSGMIYIVVVFTQLLYKAFLQALHTKIVMIHTMRRKKKKKNKISHKQLGPLRGSSYLTSLTGFIFIVIRQT